MQINQSLGQHTLALFNQGPNALQQSSSDLAFPSRSSSAVAQKSHGGIRGVPIPESDGITVPQYVIDNPQTAAERELSKRVKMYTDAARIAELRAASQARQDAKDKLRAENGYENRMSEGLKIAHSMASRQQPSEAYYETRQDAIEALSNRMSDIKSAARWVNRSRDYILIPTIIEGENARISWGSYQPQDAQDELANRSPSEQKMGAERRRHDLLASSMTYNIAVAELSRDFGVSVGASTNKDADGRVTLKDFEVTSSRFGKLGEVRDGVLYISEKTGELDALKNLSP